MLIKRNFYELRNKSEFVGINKYKSFGRAFSKARGFQKGKALCRTPQSAKLFFLKKRRKGAKTVRCDCFCVGNPRRGFPVSSLMKQRTDVGIGPYNSYYSYNKRPRQILIYRKKYGHLSASVYSKIFLTSCIG